MAGKATSSVTAPEKVAVRGPVRQSVRGAARIDNQKKPVTMENDAVVGAGPPLDVEALTRGIVYEIGIAHDVSGALLSQGSPPSGEAGSSEFGEELEKVEKSSLLRRRLDQTGGGNCGGPA